MERPALRLRKHDYSFVNGVCRDTKSVNQGHVECICNVIDDVNGKSLTVIESMTSSCALSISQSGPSVLYSICILYILYFLYMC